MRPPTLDMLAHSQQLTQYIIDKITSKGPLTFADYMQITLYCPGLGYYSAGSAKLGKAGDFVTAPELTSLFSYTLANYIAATFPMLSQQNLLEFGAGSGVMAADILLRLNELKCLPKHYFILELSAELKARQTETIQKKCPQFIDRVIWLTELPQHFIGIILANEVLDAMPVHLFHWHQNSFSEQYVDWQNNEFCFIDRPISAPQLMEYMRPYLSQLPQPYTSEIHLAAIAWIKSVGEVLAEGEVLLTDYGFEDSVYYHPQRNQGTLMCHYQHQAHSNPFVWPGLQDITAHVNFSAIAEAAVAAGLTVAEYDTQANFLLKHGLLTLAEHNDVAEQYNAAQALKQLLLPGEMGELFKVMRLSRLIDSRR